MNSPRPAGSPVIPALRYRDAHAAIAWLQQVFGFHPKEVHGGPDHTISHAELTLGNGMIMLGSASNPGPQAHLFAHPSEIEGRITHTIYLVVPDAAATCAAAQAAGAEITMPIAEMPYGGYAFACRDPEGHLWSVGEYDPWHAAETERLNVLPLPMPNPYAAQLGSHDARAVLAATPGLLQQAAAKLLPGQIEDPIAPGKWSPREIVAHLADCELVFSVRLRQILAAPAAEPALLQPFDQDVWARRYAGYDLTGALELFRANRLWNLKLVGTLSQADLDRAGHHPERGDLTFQIMLETMAGHDLNHLAQLRSINPSEA